jgi:acetoacetate decarboxylase
MNAQIFDNSNLSSDKPFFKVAPYDYEESEIYFIFFKSDPEIIKQLVPPPLKPVNDEIQLFFCYHHLVSPFKLDYYEVYFMTEVTYGEYTGGFIPVLYLNDVAGIIPGRDIAGFNKVGGDIRFEEDGKNVSISLAQEDTVIIKADFKIGIKLPEKAASGDGISLNLKYIPSALENAPPEIKQLTAINFTDKGVKLLKAAKAELEFMSTRFNPLDKIPILKIKQAGYIVSSFSLSDSKVIYDYLKD